MLFRRRTLFGALMALWADRARRSAMAWLNAALEDSAKPALRWLLGMGVHFLIAAGCAIAALAFLLSGAADGLVALGLAPWAADLILAAVAGLVGFLFYKKGAQKTLRQEVEDEPEDVAPRPLKIKIVKSVPPKPRRRRPARDVFDVHPRDERWEVTSRSPRMRESFETKEEALAAARRSAKGRGRVVVHGANGAIQDVLRYDE